MEEVSDVKPSLPSGIINNSDSCFEDPKDDFSIEDDHSLYFNDHDKPSEGDIIKSTINLSNLSAEISSLKSKVFDLITVNNTLVVSNKKLYDLLKGEKVSTSSVNEFNLGNFKEGFGTKEPNPLLDLDWQDLKSDMNIIQLTKNQCFNTNDKSEVGELLSVGGSQNSHPEDEDLIDFHSPTFLDFLNEQPEQNEKVFLSEDFSVLSEPNSATVDFVKYLENDRILLVALLNQSENIKDLGELILLSSGNFIVIKDILETLAEKIIEINKSKKHSFMEMEFDNLTELCSEIKSDIIKLYHNVLSDNETQENEFFNTKQLNQNISNYSFMTSVKEELELVKEECLQISSFSQEIEKSVEEGKCFIDNFKEEFNKVKQEILVKDNIINDLNNSVRDKCYEVTEQRNEIESCLSKINTFAIEKAYLENELKTFNDNISRLVNILAEFNRDFPFETGSLSNVMEHLSEEIKQNCQNKSLVTGLAESIQFFISQYILLISHSKDFENKLVSAQKRNTSLTNEVDELKKTLTLTKTSVAEADKFLNHIISNIPCKVTSIHHAMEAAIQIFCEYKTLKEEKRVVFDEQTMNQEKLAQLNVISSLEKYNADLQLQLGSYEHEIRNLRYEVRSLRSQQRGKEKSRIGFY